MIETISLSVDSSMGSALLQEQKPIKNSALSDTKNLAIHEFPVSHVDNQSTDLPLSHS